MNKKIKLIIGIIIVFIIIIEQILIGIPLILFIGGLIAIYFIYSGIKKERRKIV